MLNEKDIQDYTSEFAGLQPEATSKKLHELPRGTVFKLNDYPAFIRLNSLDGAYSHCTVLDGTDAGSVAHISAWAWVNPWSKQG